MKKLLLLFAVLGLIGLNSCSQDYRAEDDGNKQEQLSLRSSNKYLVHSLDDGVLIYSVNDSLFKLVDFGGFQNLNFSNIEVTSDFKVNQSVSINSDGTSYSFVLATPEFPVGSIEDENIAVAGISTFNSTEVTQEALQQSLSGYQWSSAVLNWTKVDSESTPFKLDCKCIKNNRVSSVDCDYGGEGATGCSASDSGGMFGFSWEHHCSVECGDGYFACCLKGEGSFD